MKKKKKALDVPWITEDGYVDMALIPLEGNYRTAVGTGRRSVRASISVIRGAAASGRKDAGVFLMGLLVSLPPDDWEMRSEVVEALRSTKTAACAALLFSELRRVKSSNTTRLYIKTILETLNSFPEELTWSEFDDLSEDKSFSYKMRKKFRELAHPSYNEAAFFFEDEE